MANDTIARALAIAALDGGGTGAVQSVNGKTGTVVLDAEDVGALPESTAIPTKTSDLTNDSGFLTEHQSLAAYRTSAAQDVIDAGKQATISDLATIRSGAALGATAIQQHQDISGKQDKLTAGSNITISNNTISATDTTYTAGSGISINNNVISATGGGVEKFICVYDETTFAAAKAAYEAGKELVCQFGDAALISLTCASAAVYLFALVQDGTAFEILLHEDDGWSALEKALQPALTAGTNITIDENNVISASGGGSEPAAYIKDAAVSGNTLTLTKKDDSTVQFTPSASSGVASIGGATGAITLGSGLSIADNELSATGYAPANMVTTDTAQDITGLKTIKHISGMKINDVQLFDYGGGQLNVGPNAPNGIIINPTSNSGGPNIFSRLNNHADLGTSDNRWKTLYANNLSDGTTTKTMTEVLAGGSSAPEKFVATYNVTSYDDVAAAYTANKDIYVTYTDTDTYTLRLSKKLTHNNIDYFVFSNAEINSSACEINDVIVYKSSGTTVWGTREFGDVQPKLTAGTNITIDANNVISATGGGGSSYTFTNGLTESGGTVSWDLNDTIKSTQLGSASIGYNPDNRLKSYTSSLATGYCPRASYGNNSTIQAGNGSGATYGDGGAFAHGFIPSTNGMTRHIKATGAGATAMGAYTTDNYGEIEAYGAGSMAVGADYAQALGKGSIALGKGAYAENEAQIALGRYNVKDSDNHYVLSVGNGTSDSSRSNAMTVAWDGTIESKNLPAPPTGDGNYVLKCSIVSGVATYSWVSA